MNSPPILPRPGVTWLSMIMTMLIGMIMRILRTNSCCHNFNIASFSHAFKKKLPKSIVDCHQVLGHPLPHPLRHPGKTRHTTLLDWLSVGKILKQNGLKVFPVTVEWKLSGRLVKTNQIWKEAGECIDLQVTPSLVWWLIKCLGRDQWETLDINLQFTHIQSDTLAIFTNMHQTFSFKLNWTRALWKVMKQTFYSSARRVASTWWSSQSGLSAFSSAVHL